MDLYSRIKSAAGVVNSRNFDSQHAGDLFRDGLYVGDYATGLQEDGELPVIIPIERFGSVCVADDGTHTQQVTDFMQACAIRILASVKPTLCRFVLYDSAGMGRNLISLANLDTRIKGERILTSGSELNRALEKLSDRVINVIQNVLGTKYAGSTLTRYNADAGEAAEPYYFLFLTNYPEGLSQDQCQRICRLARSGPQAGVFTFISYAADRYGKSMADREAANVLSHAADIVYYEDDKFLWHNIPDKEVYNLFPFRIASHVPGENYLDKLYARVKEELDKADEVRIDMMSEMKSSEFWQGDASAGIRVPIGKQNVTTVQYFDLSADTCHVLIGGSTGSGKSVLLHNIICNTAWRYSPEEVQLILLDYKEGTEFKVYERLPHARVLSVQSEREYGCSVFRFINEEIRRRGEVFRAAGVEGIESYNRRSPQHMPRMLVIIDEFQKLLDGDTRTANFVSAALEDVGRRGRSFGINLILSTQSLTNVNMGAVQQSLALRIVMHLNTQTDCARFLSDNNNVPYTALNRPGQAVYNALAGFTEGNVLFRTAFVGREDLVRLVDTIHERAVRRYNGEPAPYKRFFYDGSSRAEISDNPDLERYKERNDSFCTVFVGEPALLSESHVSYRLRRQNGSNILIAGADEASAMSIMTHSVRQILDQSKPDIYVFIADKTNVDSPCYGKLREAFADSDDCVFVDELDMNIQDMIEAVYAELTKRIQERAAGKRTVLILNDIYNIRPLRKQGYNKPELARRLNEILRDGPTFGIHTIVYAPSYNSLTQILDLHELLPEFEVKIEVGGGSGFRIFGAGHDERLQLGENARYLANMRIGDNGEIVKLKVYINDFDQKP